MVITNCGAILVSTHLKSAFGGEISPPADECPHPWALKQLGVRVGTVGKKARSVMQILFEGECNENQ